MSNTSPIIIYGASDDLVEVEGAVREEYQLGDEGTRLRLTAPDGDSLDVWAQFSARGRHVTLDWTLAVEATTTYPSWLIHFHERPGYEGDPAVTIHAPVGTTVEDVTHA